MCQIVTKRILKINLSKQLFVGITWYIYFPRLSVLIKYSDLNIKQGTSTKSCYKTLWASTSATRVLTLPSVVAYLFPSS